MNIPEDQGRLTIEQFANLLETSAVKKTLDLGTCILHSVLHPQRQKLILISSVEGYGFMSL